MVRWSGGQAGLQQQGRGHLAPGLAGQAVMLISCSPRLLGCVSSELYGLIQFLSVPECIEGLGGDGLILIAVPVGQSDFGPLCRDRA